MEISSIMHFHVFYHAGQACSYRLINPTPHGGKEMEEMKKYNKGVDASMSLKIPKSMMREIGAVSPWEGVTAIVKQVDEQMAIVIKLAECPECGRKNMTEMKRGGLICHCGYSVEREG